MMRFIYRSFFPPFIALLCLLLTTSNLVQAQGDTDADVQWGPKQTKGGQYLKYFIGEYDDYTYALWYSKKNFVIQKLNSKLEEVKTVIVPMTYEGKKMDHEYTIMFNEKIRVFSSFSNKKEKKNYLLVRTYDPVDLELEGGLKPLGFVPFRKKSKVRIGFGYVSSTRTDGAFSYDMSRDRKQLLLYYGNPNVKDGYEGFTFQVYSKNLVKSWEKSIELPYTNDLFGVERIRVDNKGNAHISGREYRESSEARKGSKFYIYHVLSWYDEGERASDYKVALDKKFITDLQFAIADDGNLICAGFFSNEGTFSIKGTYYLRINPNTKRVLSRSQKEFDFDFITEFMSDRALKKAAKKEAKGKEIELYQYDLDDLILRDDGGAILVGEQYYVRQSTTTTTNSNGTTSTRTTYHYYYNDIIVVNIDPVGDIDWNLRIPKKQSSTNDGGFYSSYHLSVINNELHFLFYEDNDNFDQAPGEKPDRTSSYESIALVKVPLSGKYTKEKLIDKEDIDVRLVPKMFSNRSDKEILTFGKFYKRFQIGRITFE